MRTRITSLAQKVSNFLTVAKNKFAVGCHALWAYVTEPSRVRRINRLAHETAFHLTIVLIADFILHTTQNVFSIIQT